MKDLITTTIKTEVETKIPGLRRFNEINETLIYTREGNMSIVVKYLDYHIDGDGNRFDVKNNHYRISPNPNNFPLIPPQIEDPENEGQFIDDVSVELFDPATDDYFKWVNGAMGEGIASATIDRLHSINGNPPA